MTSDIFRGNFTVDDVTDRIEELESVLEEALEAIEELDDAATPDVVEALLALKDSTWPDMHEELVELRVFKDEVGDSEQFILDENFKDYARDLAKEAGLVDESASWPYTCIDWAAAAEELKQDYTSVEMQGNTVWYRD